MELYYKYSDRDARNSEIALVPFPRLALLFLTGYRCRIDLHSDGAGVGIGVGVGVSSDVSLDG